MMSDTIADETPYVEPPDAALSKWPTVIGVISLIYAIGGLLCGLGYGISIVFMKWLMALGGMDVETPPIIAITGVIMAMFMFILGLVMVTGAIKLLRRRRSGVKLLQTWAILRVVLIVIGILVTVATAPAQIQFQRSMVEAQTKQLREAGRTDLIPPEKTDEEIWRNAMLTAGGMSLALAIYPVFIVFYLSRKKITAEVQEWR